MMRDFATAVSVNGVNHLPHTMYAGDKLAVVIRNVVTAPNKATIVKVTFANAGDGSAFSGARV